MNTPRAPFIWQSCAGYEPVQTGLGTFHGRDCIYLDSFEELDGGATISLRGEVTGSLCRPPRPEQFVPYSLRFIGVVAYEHTDIDAWTWRSASCFDRAVGSAWLSRLGEAVSRSHTHFLVQTYDDVYDLIAEDFEFHAIPKNI